MSVPVITFMSSKGGVGKTSLVYHVAWMLADLGYRVVAADLDPQTNLSSVCLTDEQLFAITNAGQTATVYQALSAVQSGTADVVTPTLQPLGDCLALLCGDLGMSEFESELTDAWSRFSRGDDDAVPVFSRISDVLQLAAKAHRADVFRCPPPQME